MKGKKDEKKFSQLMKGLAVIFDLKGTLSPIKIELYFKALEDLSIDQIEKNAGELIRDREYLTIPVPAQIRKKTPAKLLTGLSAWLLVEKCLEGGVKPTDPVINKAVEGMGGFDRLGLLPYSELTWTQKEFERRFELLNQSRDMFKLLGPTENRPKVIELNP